MTKKIIHYVLIFFLLSSCQSRDKANRILESPYRDYHILLSENDLGACCSSITSARIVSNDNVFGELDEELFKIRGASNVQVSWLTPYQIEVLVCNASKISYRSDFSSVDYKKHIHINLVNVFPERSGGKVVCHGAVDK